MLSSFPSTSVDSSSISSPSPSSTQAPADYLQFDDQGRNSQFSSSFSIRAILSSSSNSPPAQLFPSSISYRQLLLAGDAGPFDYSAQFPHHHCCQHGACAVNWKTDKGRSVEMMINGDKTINGTTISCNESMYFKQRMVYSSLIWIPGPG